MPSSTGATRSSSCRRGVASRSAIRHPRLQMAGLAVIVSPLISLMKDQVDALADCGVPAACINSTLSYDEKRSVTNEIRSGRLKLLYLSPERLMTERTLEFLKGISLSFVAIDEAHCISEWGHDFRPEYRTLRLLKETFPGIAVHAYTATATRHVREDIARELRLENPEILVGSFDRPNLVYRVQRRSNLTRQVRDVMSDIGTIRASSIASVGPTSRGCVPSCGRRLRGPALPCRHARRDPQDEPGRVHQ